MGPVRWLVDGMNVIGTRPDAWWRDRHAAMVRLVDLLERWAAVNGEERVAEIARMLGGERLSGTTLAHAKEMLGQ